MKFIKNCPVLPGPAKKQFEGIIDKARNIGISVFIRFSKLHYNFLLLFLL